MGLGVHIYRRFPEGRWGMKGVHSHSQRGMYNTNNMEGYCQSKQRQIFHDLSLSQLLQVGHPK
jgi:hypothetical protein